MCDINNSDITIPSVAWVTIWSSFVIDPFASHTSFIIRSCVPSLPDISHSSPSTPVVSGPTHQTLCLMLSECETFLIDLCVQTLGPLCECGTFRKWGLLGESDSLEVGLEAFFSWYYFLFAFCSLLCKCNLTSQTPAPIILQFLTAAIPSLPCQTAYVWNSKPK